MLRSMMNFAQARTNMVDSQIHTAGVVDPALLYAFETVPREQFVPEHKQNVAYCDEEISCGDGRFLLEPLTLSKMLQAVEPKADDVVLDIGGATGYSATILSSIVTTVVALEENKEYLKHAERVWKNLEACNIVGIEGKLKDGYAKKAPFDLIFINGAVAKIPEDICAQLAPGGRLICIVKKPGEIVGQATLVKMSESQTLGENQFSSYNVFDAGAPYLPGYEPEVGFSF